MPAQVEGEWLLVVDAMEMRRAGLTLLVAPWAKAASLSILDIPPEKIGEHLQNYDVRLIILNVGGETLHARGPHDVLSSIREFFPASPCAIVSDRRDPGEAVEAASLGEQAFLSTDMRPEIASQALTFILGGGTYFPREAILASTRVGHEPRLALGDDDEADAEGLTRRQHDVLERLRFGKANKVIARELNMQESTVKVHVRQIMRKLGAANRTQAALLATNVARPPGHAANQVVRSNGGVMPVSIGGLLQSDSRSIPRKQSPFDLDA